MQTGTNRNHSYRKLPPSFFPVLPPPGRVLKPDVDYRQKRELKAVDLKTPHILKAVQTSYSSFLYFILQVSFDNVSKIVKTHHTCSNLSQQWDEDFFYGSSTFVSATEVNQRLKKTSSRVLFFSGGGLCLCGGFLYGFDANRKKTI